MTPTRPPTHDPWFVPAAGYADGFAIGVLVNICGICYADRRGIPFEKPVCVAVVLAALAPLAAGVLVARVRSRWEARYRVGPVDRAAALKAAAVGLLHGAPVGLLLGGLILLPPTPLVVAAGLLVLFATPLLGTAWLLSRRPTSQDADYDEGMAKPEAVAELRLDLPDLTATEALGRRLGGLLFPNAVVALVGPLGAGKTHLVRAVAEGLGIANPAAVTSPTFTLVHEYPARLPVFHFDAYRLSGPDAFLDLGATEYYQAGGVCLIEWADRVEIALPDERLTVRLAHHGGDARRAEVSAVGPAYVRLVDGLKGTP